MFLIGEAPGSLLRPTGRPFTAVLPARRVSESHVDCPRQGLIDARSCEDCSHAIALTAECTLCMATGTEPVWSWMTPAVRIIATSPGICCAVADAEAARAGVHHLPVLDAERQLVAVSCRCDLRGCEGLVADVMSRDVFATGPSTTLAAALAAMEQLRVGCLPVVDGALLLGLVTRTDLQRAGARVSPRAGRVD